MANRRRWIAGFITLAALLGPGGGAALAAPTVEDDAAAWIKSLQGKAYKTVLRSADGKSPLPSIRINEHLFAFSEGDVYVGIGFTKPPFAQTPLAELQRSFKHLALDKVPIPTIHEANWETRLQTPVSSFSKGVTLESYKDGVLRIRVQTEFFAAYGRRTDILLPADAGMPAGTYFQIRTPIKSDLVIEGRLFDASQTR